MMKNHYLIGGANPITLETPLKFTAPGGVAYAGRGKWRLPIGDQPGEWMRDYKTKPVLCERGYHWCVGRHVLHHMHAECYLIETRGETVTGNNKNVSQGARLLRRVETWNERTQRLFAADCAEAVVHLCGDDPRLREAIAVARRFARGEATKEELTTASDNAWGAVRDDAPALATTAVRDDARAAVMAATGATAWTAAWTTARAAVMAAAEAAARATAMAAAMDDAWIDARNDAWDAQTILFLQYLNGERA